MRWKPWEDYNKRLGLIKEITKPPCPHCKFWFPVCLYADPFNKYTEVRCCHAEEQYRDFCCFEEKIKDAI